MEFDERLKKAIQQGTVYHAYIFEGDRNSDKTAFAKKFAKAVLCKEYPGEGCNRCRTCKKIEHGNHEDIVYVKGRGKTGVKDEEIEEVQQRLKTKPNEARNIAVIEKADTMTVRAQNRFLKTLEEPPQDAVIILLSENIENLLPTVVSRCAIYRIDAEYALYNEEIMGTAREFVGMIFENKPFFMTSKKIEEHAEDRGKALELLDALETVYAEKMRNTDNRYIKEDIYRAIYAVETARKEIVRGIAHKSALKKAIIEIGG